MLGFLGGISVVALFLMRNEFKPAMFFMWAVAAGVGWFHAHGSAFCGVVGV